MTKQVSQISEDISKSQTMVQYDQYAKNLLSYACLQAWILKGFTSEFHSWPVHKICSILTGKKMKGIVLDGESKIQMLKTRDEVIGQRDIEFDTYYGVTVPGANAKIHVNVELQKKPKMKSWLRKRGWYYVSRLTTRQSGIVFDKAHYEKIEKVYSIWIVGGKRKKSMVERYALRSENDSLNVMELIIVYLGDAEDTSVSPIEQLLNALFSATISIEKKKKLLRDQFHIEMNTDMGRTVESMCNLSVSFFEDGKEAGYKEGRKEGIKKGRKEGHTEGFKEAKREVAIILASEGFSPEHIARLLKTDSKQVRGWMRIKVN